MLKNSVSVDSRSCLFLSETFVYYRDFIFFIFIIYAYLIPWCVRISADYLLLFLLVWKEESLHSIYFFLNFRIQISLKKLWIVFFICFICIQQKCQDKKKFWWSSENWNKSMWLTNLTFLFPFVLWLSCWNTEACTINTCIFFVSFPVFNIVIMSSSSPIALLAISFLNVLFLCELYSPTHERKKLFMKIYIQKITFLSAFLLFIKRTFQLYGLKQLSLYILFEGFPLYKTYN